MLEAGIVQPKNSTNILFKNMIDASMAAMAFWLLGYGIAYGVDDGQGFIGTSTAPFRAAITLMASLWIARCSSEEVRLLATSVPVTAISRPMAPVPCAS